MKRTTNLKMSQFEDLKMGVTLFLNHRIFKSSYWRFIAICTFAYLPIYTFSQNVGINATGITPDNSAMLDVTSNTKGMLIPRMTGNEKYAIPSPATGLLIFQTDTVGFWYYDGTKWIPLVSSTSSMASPANAGWLTTGNSGTAWNKHFLGTTDKVSLRVRTNNLQRMYIDSATGYVGIGTTNPGSKLHILGGNSDQLALDNAGQQWTQQVWLNNSTAKTFIAFDNTNNNFIIGGYTAYAAFDRISIRPDGNTDVLVVKRTGNVGIGCTDPKYKLHVVGNAGVVGTIYATVASVTSGVLACSDIRYKKDITPLPNALNNVMKLQGVNYHWKTDAELKRDGITSPLSFGEGQGVRQLGFIAQEIEKIYPEVVMTDKDGYKSVDYSRLTPVLVEAIKEQQSEIAELKIIVNKLMQQSTTAAKK